MENAKHIIEYYDLCEADYRTFWDLDYSLAMHAGFWDNSVKTLRQALARENEVLAEMAGINSRDFVLDAGCGVGGSSILLEEKHHCAVTGITLCQKQVDAALKNSLGRKLSPCPDFQVANFCRTGFPNDQFDVVWAVESVCHAEKKLDFVKEAFRLLKSKGRLIIADGFLKKKHLSLEEERQMSKWIKGWGCNSLEDIEVFKDHILAAGFHLIGNYDVTPLVLPSSKRLFYLSFPAMVMSKVGEWLKLRHPIQSANIAGAFYQYQTLKKRLWAYGIFLAEKP